MRPDFTRFQARQSTTLDAAGQVTATAGRRGAWERAAGPAARDALGLGPALAARLRAGRMTRRVSVRVGAVTVAEPGYDMSAAAERLATDLARTRR